MREVINVLTQHKHCVMRLLYRHVDVYFHCKTQTLHQVGAALCSKRAYSTTDEQRMMPFKEYRRLRRRLKMRARLAGLPVACVGVGLSSAINVHFHPQMLEFQNPDVELAPIL